MGIHFWELLNQSIIDQRSFAACIGLILCDAAIVFEGFDDLPEHFSGFVHPFQQGAVGVCSSGFTDIPQCLLAFLIKRVLERVRVGEEEGFVDLVFHELAGPLDGIHGDDGIVDVLADGVQDGQLAHFFECASPECGRDDGFELVVLAVDIVVLVIQLGVGNSMQRFPLL